MNGSRQPDRFAGQLDALQCRADAARVPLVEDQIKHVEHRAKPLRMLAIGRQSKRHARGLDGLLGPADPLRHRAFRYQERVGDLRRRQAANGAQRQRDRRGGSQRGMTAHEEQHERVVPLSSWPGCLRSGANGSIGRRFVPGNVFTLPPRCFAAEVIGHAAGRDVNEPAARIVGDPFLRPLHARRDQRLLHRIFGGGEIPEAADDGAENLRRELAQQALGVRIQPRGRHGSTGGALITSRTSIGMLSGFPPGPAPPTHPRRSRNARAALSTSTIQ